MNKLVIIHGWGDELSTLKPLARLLQHHTRQDVVDIFLGNYITLDDDIRMSDLTVGFDRAWRSKNLHQENKVNLLAYSTGALIIRNWLHQFFTREK
ncbi:MAG: hypothetical protein P8X74_21925 [Reinekea sp.]